MALYTNSPALGNGSGGGNIGAYQGTGVQLATLTVNSSDDNTTDTNVLTLREALTLINNGGNLGALGQSSIPSGWQSQITGVIGDEDTIDFALANGSVITLDGTALPAIAPFVNLTISGPGAGNLAISGNNQSGILSLNAPVNDGSGQTKVKISGLTLEGGKTTGNGGGIDNTGATVTVSNCFLPGNSASSGGGIFNQGGTLTVNKSTLSGNTAAKDGGGIDSLGTLTLSQSKVNGDNSAGGNGGGIAFEVSGSARVTSCTISGNTSGGTGNGSGGGIYCGGGTLTVNNSKIQDNSSQQFGGGIYGSHITVNSSTIQGNKAFGAGDIDGGGGIEDFGWLTLSNSTVAGNQATAGDGGGIDSRGTSLIVNSCTFSDNSSGGLGDGIFVGGGSIRSCP